MKELQSILKAVSAFENQDQKAILATVVALEGSGYRRPGARMLIDENGYSIGTVSGGCLEADVLERAKKVLQTGEPIVITYDTTKDENSVFGLGMGCRGIVRILLERITKEDFLFAFSRNAFKERKSFSTATLISSNEKYLPIGTRLFYKDFKFAFSGVNPNIPNEMREALKIFSDKVSAEVETFSFGEIFLENINPPLNLQLFGAGFDALPLVKFAKELGWRVSVVDHRAAYANRERLPEADEIIVSNSEDLEERFFQNENSVAVIMTHNYERDKNILRRLLKSKSLYVGALGPKKRTEKILEEIGENFSEEQLKKLHAPIGLDIGAKTPEEIALAIVAEIQTVLANRCGGFLRERKGSIYGRSE